jgi:hypothetical protein
MVGIASFLFVRGELIGRLWGDLGDIALRRFGKFETELVCLNTMIALQMVAPRYMIAIVIAVSFHG